MPREVLVLIIIALTMVPTLTFVFLAMRRISHPLATTEAFEGSEWRLGAVVRQGRKCRLCMRYEVTFQGGEDNFGLVVDHACTTPVGEVRERAGVGSVEPPARDRRIGTQYNVRFSSVMGGCRQKATFILATVGPFPGPAELDATGTVRVSGGAVLVSGMIFFA